MQDLLKASGGLNLGVDFLPGSFGFDPAAAPTRTRARCSGWTRSPPTSTAAGATRTCCLARRPLGDRPRRVACTSTTWSAARRPGAVRGPALRRVRPRARRPPAPLAAADAALAPRHARPAPRRARTGPRRVARAGRVPRRRPPSARPTRLSSRPPRRGRAPGSGRRCRMSSRMPFQYACCAACRAWSAGSSSTSAWCLLPGADFLGALHVDRDRLCAGPGRGRRRGVRGTGRRRAVCGGARRRRGRPRTDGHPLRLLNAPRSTVVQPGPPHRHHRRPRGRARPPAGRARAAARRDDAERLTISPTVLGAAVPSSPSRAMDPPRRTGAGLGARCALRGGDWNG